jgi:predicted metal-dependent HD superfamily phosphohydrolase
MRAAGDARRLMQNRVMDPRVNFGRWSTACVDVGIVPSESDYRRVRRAWRGMGRHYHTLSHLDSCLREFDGARELALRPAEVELALWFHDAVYRGWRRDNEARSAALAADVLRGASIESVERIRQMILATLHDDGGFSGDTALVIDIDLSILGAPPDVYSRFESAIRREYWWVPRARYVAGRSKILARFLGRNAIYTHDFFYDRYERAARANIAAALGALKGSFKGDRSI